MFKSVFPETIFPQTKSLFSSKRLYQEGANLGQNFTTQSNICTLYVYSLWSHHVNSSKTWLVGGDAERESTEHWPVEAPEEEDLGYVGFGLFDGVR